MTVLTFPPTGSKSDKMPLVNDVDRQDRAAPLPPTPPPYHPKFVESGEAGLLKDASVPDVGTTKDGVYESVIFRTVRVVLLLMLIGTIIMYSSNVLCKTFKKDKAHFEKIPEQRDSDIRDSTRLYKSYTSYADAESEMLNMPPSPVDNDYDQRLGLDPMEDVYNKLNDIAVNKGGVLGQKKTSPTGVVSMYNPNFTIDRKDTSISPLVITKSARFIHDFSVNITGIVDVDKQRCFVMPLVRNSLSPPISLYDLLFKMSSGYYSTDLKKFMGNMRVIEPAVTDLSAYGLYISKDCADYSTYKLENVETATEV